ncbi:unnamed protein product [Psylliodes chrysocephalus]|uniref:Sushi domain-containing protein n=1 Tax=Psylliodes chrysocephalus TaxID=3402493 RepID=A0A9P0CDB1_9CUCU|nr:unnamed protein product [Psylliodes chrysocephala]
MFWKQYIYLNLAASVFLYVKGYAISNENNDGECILPSYPQNGKWVITGGSEASPGSTVPTNSTISFSCNDPYKVSGDYSKIICLGKDWNLPPPECLSVEKLQKAKRGVTVTKTGYGEVIIENNERPQRITVGGRFGDGIVVQSDGSRLVVSSGQGITLGGNEEEIVGGRVRGNRIDRKGVQVGGTEGDGIVIGTGEKRGVVVGLGVEGRSNSYTRQTITLGGKVGDGIVVKSDGNILAVSSGQGVSIRENEQDGIIIGSDGEIIGGRGSGGIQIDRNGIQIGGTGGDGIVIGTGGRRVVVGPGDEGRPNSFTRQTITLGGKVGDGIVVQSDGDGVVVLGGNEEEIVGGGEGGGIRIDRKGIHIGEAARDGIAIGTGGTRVVVGREDEESVDSDARRATAEGKGETAFVNGGSRAGGERTVLKAPENTRQRGDGQTVDDEGRRGQDGLVIRDGETVNGYAVGVGQPGGSGEQIGGRGGDGGVVNGGDVNGVLVGIGGEGGNAGSASSNNKRKQGQDEKPELTSTNQNGKQRKKRQTVTTYKSESSSYSKSESSSYSKVTWTTFSIGGGGGHGVVIYGGTINGNVYGVGGAGGK